MTEKGFEKNLQGLGALAAQEMTTVHMSDAEQERFAEEKAAALAEMVELTQTDPQTQEAVYRLQQKKSLLMASLHEQLEKLDDPSAENVGQGRGVSFDANTGAYLMREKGGSQRPITLGDITTGEAWGQQYRLDTSVPRNIRKRYLVQRAHRQLHELLDQQIAITEARSWFNKDTGKDTAYEAIALRAETPLLEQGAGVIAEKLVSSLLTRLSIDHQLPFEVVESNAHADVEYKIDFTIHIKDNDLGVSVETNEKAHDVPIQFTTKTALVDIEHKQKQAARASRHLAAEEGRTVEKIAVVSVPIDRIKMIVAEWKENQKNRVGGPDKLLSRETQERIFKNILCEVFPDEAVQRMWSQTEAQQG